MKEKHIKEAIKLLEEYKSVIEKEKEVSYGVTSCKMPWVRVKLDRINISIKHLNDQLHQMLKN